jgi:hypothetical protein
VRGNLEILQSITGPTIDAINNKITNVDNTRDSAKPISTLTQTALDNKLNTSSTVLTNLRNDITALENVIDNSSSSWTADDKFQAMRFVEVNKGYTIIAYVSDFGSKYSETFPSINEIWQKGFRINVTFNEGTLNPTLITVNKITAADPINVSEINLNTQINFTDDQTWGYQLQNGYHFRYQYNRSTGRIFFKMDTEQTTVGRFYKPSAGWVNATSGFYTISIY